MPTVHLTSTARAGAIPDDEALALLTTCRTVLRESAQPFAHVDDPAEADLIVFVEPPSYKPASYAEGLLASEALRRFPERCFVYDWYDWPARFLPGVYPGLSRRQVDPGWCLPGGYLRSYNAAVDTAARALSAPALSATREPEFLLSFRGALTHAVRHRLSQTSAIVDDTRVDFHIQGQWYEHTDAERDAYVQGILNSRFVLCPRGVSPTSYRIYESMALGRAPVIVSDDWAPPAGPDWGTFSLTVGEREISELPTIVRRHESEWADMGRMARQAWDEFFALPRLLAGTLQSIEQISLARVRGNTVAELEAWWASGRFRRQHGWTASQRAGRLFTSEEARRRLLKRVTVRP